jgi:4-amino-4-deoxy-L-arabinose transferase-like glycosyltransferase
LSETSAEPGAEIHRLYPPQPHGWCSPASAPRYLAGPFALLLLAAFAIRVAYLSLPGPYGDEMSFILPAYESRWHTVLSNIITMEVLGRQVPVMFNPYTGATPIYVQMVMARLPHMEWFAYRLPDIVYALLAIVATYLLVAEVWGITAAWIAALVLAFMPAFVFYSRVGEPWLFLRVVISSTLLLTTYRWWRTGRWGYWYAAAWLAGIGISTRLETLWWIIALPSALLITHRRAWGIVWGRVRAAWWHGAGGVGLALLGASPFLVYNLQTAPNTVHFIRANLRTTFYGEHNAAVVHHLQVRAGHLVTILGGGDGAAFGLAGLGLTNPVHVAIFLVALGSLAALAWRARWRGAPLRSIELVLVTLGLLFVMSLFTVSVLRPYHLLMLFPLPALIVARGLLTLRRPWLIALMTTILVLGDLWTDAYYYRTLIRTHGVGLFSSGIFDLVARLRHDGARSVVACDYGLLPQIVYLSRGQISGQEIFASEMGYDAVPPAFYDALAVSLRNPDRVYLFHAPRYEQYPRRQAFLRYMKALSEPYEERIISDRNGPVYYMYLIRGSPEPLRFDRPEHHTRGKDP